MHWASAPLTWADPALTDDVVRLDRMTEADVPDLVRACNDPDIARWLPVPSPYTESDARDFLEVNVSAARAGALLNHAIRPADSHDLAGSIGLHPRGEATGEIGYWIAPWARRHGYARRAIRLLATHALAALPVHRVEILVEPSNLASIAVALSAGAQPEGLRRNGGVAAHADEPVDMRVYSLVPGDLDARVRG